MANTRWKYDFSDLALNYEKSFDVGSIQDTYAKIGEALEKSISNSLAIELSSYFEKHYSSCNSIAESLLSAKSILDRTDNFYKSYAESMVSNIGSSLLSSDLFSTYYKNSAALTKAVAKIDWSWLSEEYSAVVSERKAEDGEIDDTLNFSEQANVTEKVRSEIASDITDIFSDPNKIQETSCSKYLQWKERNPGQAAFFLEILIPIIGIIIQILCSVIPIWSASTNRNTRVYEEPSSKSTVIYNITVDQEVTVIGDARYFREVELIDPETGEHIVGYVYKGNLQPKEDGEISGYSTFDNDENIQDFENNHMGIATEATC